MRRRTRARSSTPPPLARPSRRPHDAAPRPYAGGRVKLGLAHEIGLALAATCAIVIVLVDGELPAFAWIALAAPWISAGVALTNRSVPPLSSTLLGLGSIA